VKGLGNLELFESGNISRNDAEGSSHKALLPEHIDSKSANIFHLDREIKFSVLLEERFLLVVENRVDQLLGQIGIELLVAMGNELSLITHHGRVAHGEDDVRRIALCSGSQYVENIHRGSRQGASQRLDPAPDSQNREYNMDMPPLDHGPRASSQPETALFQS